MLALCPPNPNEFDIAILIFAFLGSYLLRITSTSHSMILVGTFFIILIWGLIQYMKPRLGLNPKEYDEKEIFNSIL